MQRHPEHSPPARWGGSMVYDSNRGRLIMYGGRQSTTDDPFTTWEWDLTDWHPTTTSTGPFEGYGVRLAYDPSRERIVAYGYGETAEYYVSGG